MKKSKGISLIVLIITIIVIIILAGSVILSLSSNNPIDKANEATFKTTNREYSTQLDMESVSSFANGINPFDLEVSSANIKDHISVIKPTDETKYNIQNGELAYIGTNAKEGLWINELDILNGNIPKMQGLKVPSVPAIDEGLTSAAATSDGKFVTITSMTVSTQRHAFVNLIDKDYNLVKRVDLFITNNTSLREVLVLSNGNIAVVGYTMDASNVSTAIMLLYSPSLDELKREIYPIPKTGYTSWGRNVVSTPAGGYMVLNSAEKLNASQQITDAYASIYSYDANGNKILNNIEVRGLDGSIFLVYDGVVSPNGNIYLCGNNYKSAKATPNVIGINTSGIVKYEYVLTTASPYGEYRYMSILSDGTLVLERISCTSSAGNPYDTAVETVDYLNVTTNVIKNINLSIPTGLPIVLDISTGYKDNVFVVALDTTESPAVYKYKIYKLSKAGDIRWISIGQAGQMNVALKVLYPSKNKYIMFGQYKATSTSVYAAYVADMVP
jgi:hypothetical protein